MKKLLLILSIFVLSISVFAQTEMKINRDINLLNNNILNADTIHTMNLKINYKDLDSLLAITNFGVTFTGDSVVLGAIDDDHTPGYIYLSDGLMGGVRLDGGYNTLLINGVQAATTTETDSLAEDIAALAGFAAWEVDSTTIDLSGSNVLSVKTSFINLYETVAGNNTKLSAKANLASPIFSGTVTIPILKLGSTNLTVNGTRLNYLSSATGVSGAASSLLVFSYSPAFTGYVTLPTTTTIGNVNSTELNYLDLVTGPIQSQLDAKMSGNFVSQYIYTAAPDLIDYILLQQASGGAMRYTRFTDMPGFSAKLDTQFTAQVGYLPPADQVNGANKVLIETEDGSDVGAMNVEDLPVNLESIYVNPGTYPDGTVLTADGGDVVGVATGTAGDILEIVGSTPTWVTQTKTFCLSVDSLRLATDSLITLFRVVDTVTVDSVFAIVQGGTSVTFRPYQGNTRTTAGGLKLFEDEEELPSSTTAGTTYASTNEGVSANTLIWLWIANTAGAPKELFICIYYH